ncbi:MAG: hypothetical protein K6A34_06090 [Methanobrevibacter sp.]|nr:hypothetical protein [Methanobrevibacter sp.]
MRTINDITLTNGREFKTLDLVVNKVIDNRKIEQTIDETVDSSKTRTGVITKFYPYLDKAEVKLDNVAKPVLCRILHRMGGVLIDFFTPEGELDYCETLQEPCILPREELHVLVADISNIDAKEMLLLGYYHPEDIVGIKPADQGYLKITNIGATNTWGVQIGNGEIKVSTNEGVVFEEGEFKTDDTVINYANDKDTYTKDEVNELLLQLKQEILDEINEG